MLPPAPRTAPEQSCVASSQRSLDKRLLSPCYKGLSLHNRSGCAAATQFLRRPEIQGALRLAATSETILELVEIELRRVRSMAAPAGDDALLYLIDMAIMEAKSKASSPPPNGKNSAAGRTDGGVRGPNVG